MNKAQATATKTSAPPEAEQTRVGVAVYLISPTGQFLIGHRTSKHGNSTWAPPGGHVEFGEDPLQTAVREVQEEVGVRIPVPTFVGFSSDLFEESGQHYVTLCFATRLHDTNMVHNMEPDKCDELRWVYYDELPDNLFLPVQNFVDKLGLDGLKHMLATFPR